MVMTLHMGKPQRKKRRIAKLVFFFIQFEKRKLEARIEKGSQHQTRKNVRSKNCEKCLIFVLPRYAKARKG